MGDGPTTPIETRLGSAWSDQVDQNDQRMNGQRNNTVS